MLKPVPGILTDPLTPLGLALTVSWNGPSLICLLTDLIPCSVMFTPWMVRSKLMGDFLVTWDPPAWVPWHHRRPCLSLQISLHWEQWSPQWNQCHVARLIPSSSLRAAWPASVACQGSRECEECWRMSFELSWLTRSVYQGSQGKGHASGILIHGQYLCTTWCYECMARCSFHAAVCISFAVIGGSPGSLGVGS